MTSRATTTRATAEAEAATSLGDLAVSRAAPGEEVACETAEALPSHGNDSIRAAWKREPDNQASSLPNVVDRG
jgi:hypothetical protein